MRIYRHRYACQTIISRLRLLFLIAKFVNQAKAKGLLELGFRALISVLIGDLDVVIIDQTGAELCREPAVNCKIELIVPVYINVLRIFKVI